MDYTNYLIRLKNWIIEGRYLYAYLVLLVLPLVFVRFEINDTGIRFYGLILQLVGIIPLLLSLKDKSLLFDKDTLYKSFINYFKRFPGKAKNEVVNISGLSSGISITALDPRVKNLPKENYQEIIQYFEKEINYLDERITKENREIKEKVHELVQKIESIDRALNKTIKELETKVEVINTSTVSRDYFGIFTLGYGLILSTIPEIMERFYYWI